MEVFFHELVEGGGELVFVGAGLGLDGVGHGGLGHGDGVDAEVVAFVAEGVAGVGDAELGDDAEVAGVELGDFDELAALHDADVGEALGLGAGVVFERGFVADAAADDFEEGDAAGEGVDRGSCRRRGRRARCRRGGRGRCRWSCVIGGGDGGAVAVGFGGA